jgi:hypothetical protein
MWEYLCVSASDGPLSQSELDEHGRNRWELVALEFGRFPLPTGSSFMRSETGIVMAVFKRPRLLQ